MRIAVASQNFRTVTPHAGVTRRFLVFESVSGEAPREVARLDLPKEMTIREFSGPGAHPLDAVDAVLVGSFGEGFIRRMSDRGVEAVVTSETDPLKAVQGYLAATLPVRPERQSGIAAGDDCYGRQLRLQQRTSRRTRGCGEDPEP